MRTLVQPPPSMHCELCGGELRFKGIERDYPVDTEVQIFVCEKCGHEHQHNLVHDRYSPRTANAISLGTVLPYKSSMDEVHPFSIMIEADALNPRRSRWSLCEGNQILMRSPHSYATRREGENEASEAMKRRIATWERNR